MWKSVNEFLKEKAVPNVVLKELSPFMDKMASDKVEILTLDKTNYLWSINKKFVLCDLNDMGKNDVSDNIISMWEKAIPLLRANKKRRVLYTSMKHFIDAPPSAVIDMMFMHGDVFNIKKLQEMDNKDLSFTLDLITNNIDTMVSKFNDNVIGITLPMVKAFHMPCRYIIYRVFSGLTNGYIIKKFIRMKKAHDIVAFCDKLIAQYTGKQSGIVYVLLKFIRGICHAVDANEFRKYVLSVITTNDNRPKTTFKRPSIANTK